MRQWQSINISGKTTLVLLLTLGLSSCVHDTVLPPKNPNQTGGSGGTGGGGGTGGTGGKPCDPSIVYFEKQVLPLLISNCGMDGCHSANSAQDGIILTSYSSLIGSDIVKPGDANGSDLYEVLIETDPDDRMPRPPAAPLSGEQINLIRTWINQGAQNIICNPSDCDTVNITYSGTIKPLLATNCQGCHSGTSPSAGIDLSAHAGTQTVAINGRLNGALNHLNGFKPMPQGGNKLSDCDLNKVRKWINMGAPNN